MSALRKAALAASAGRVVIGTAMLARPAQIGESWIGEAGRFERVGVLTRAVGARDVGLGAVAVAGLASGRDDLARTGLLAGAFCDTADFLAMLVARDKLPPKAFAQIGPVAVGSALLCAAAAADI